MTHTRTHSESLTNCTASKQATHAILSYILYHALYHSVIELHINNEKYVSISQKN